MIWVVPDLIHSFQKRGLTPASGFEEIPRPSPLTPFGRTAPAERQAQLFRRADAGFEAVRYRLSLWPALTDHHPALARF
jgi:hypothetical protein